MTRDGTETILVAIGRQVADFSVQKCKTLVEENRLLSDFQKEHDSFKFSSMIRTCENDMKECNGNTRQTNQTTWEPT